MKRFGEYLNENIMPFAQTEKGFVGVDNGAVRDNINMLLSRATAMSVSSPYHAMEAVRKVLATYHIFIPNTNFLDGDSGHEIFTVNQFGDKYGFDVNGDMRIKIGSPYHIYFEYAMNDHGRFDVFSEIVTDDELEEILADFEEEYDDEGEHAEVDSADYTHDTYKADNKDEAEDVEDDVEELEDMSHMEDEENDSDDVRPHNDDDDEEIRNKVKKYGKDEAEEHGLSQPEGEKTALDHLRQDKKYYEKLKKAGLEESADTPKGQKKVQDVFMRSLKRSKEALDGDKPDRIEKAKKQLAIMKMARKRMQEETINEVSYKKAKNAGDKAKKEGDREHLHAQFANMNGKPDLEKIHAKKRDKRWTQAQVFKKYAAKKDELQARYDELEHKGD